MLRHLLFRALPILFLLAALRCSAQTLEELEAQRVRLPNGWSLTPAGTSLPLGDLPLNMVLSPHRDLLAVTNNGQSDQTLQLIDTKRMQVLDTLLMGKAWIGLAFSDDGRSLYASGGNDNSIVRFDVSDRRFVAKDTIRIGKPWPVAISPAGIALDDKQHMLYTVTTEDSALYAIDLTGQHPLRKFALGAEGYTCLLAPDGGTLYASCWGCDRVALFDTKRQAITGSIPVGDNPNELCMDRRGKRLFVANANDNSVSVIDLEQRRVIETLNAALYPDAPEGSTTNSVALSPDDKTLYIANADNNCLAVFDVGTPGSSRSLGFIPTGWYPTCVRTVGDRILVANGKGFRSMANPNGPQPAKKEEHVGHAEGVRAKKKVQYIGGLFRGTLSIIPAPDAAQLAVYALAVYRNTPYTKAGEDVSDGAANNPIPRTVGDASPIHHVFYIIKENRTYDQVLGDMPTGNGDTSLVLFGARITPNEHALAKQFVLLDNFYVDGEVSADGHNWTCGAYATDFLEKTWPTLYGDRGGYYNSEGGRRIANNKAFIWDLCQRYGVSYRTYGEFVDGHTPNLPVLRDHYCRSYTSWDQSVTDTTRYGQWRRDFDSLLTIGQVPQFNTLRFINDHTQGVRLGAPTPYAQAADNDLAVGLFVQHLSESPIWNESVVFIVEDDAQDGPDHVDAHRTTAYVAGGRVKRDFADHTPYSTSGMLRTMELILGLPPMSQYDAGAEPMWRCFMDSTDASGFTALPANVDLHDLNTAMNEWQRASETFDFTAEDRVPDGAFNTVLWGALRNGAAAPPPVHAAFVAWHPGDADDDDR